METNEMTMTSNTPVLINQDTAIVEHERHENSPIAPEIESNEQPDRIGDNTDTSQKVLESAKDEGFLEALTHLAQGDFDDEQHIKPDDEKENPEKESGINSEEDENIVELTAITEEEPLIAKIKELESKVADLEEKNTRLNDQIQTLQESNKVALQTLLEMTLILQKIIDEEDKKEKISLLELLIEMMGQLMKQMFVPDDESSNENNKTQTQTTPKKGKPRINAKEAMELLRQRRLLENPEPETKSKETSTPLIENASS